MSMHDVRLFGDQIAASRLESRFSALSPTALLRFAVKDLFAGKIALVSSFGADSAVLLHMIAEIDKATPVVFVDTGQLFSETLGYRDTLVARFGLTDVRSVSPDPERLAESDPEGFLWMGDPDACCDIRKVLPLGAALDGFEAWITGRKRFQSTTRAALSLFEAEGERVKINPLAGWTASDVLDYLKRLDLPPHPLVARGFPSIGCMPCTSRVAPGEDSRAGRWRGRAKVECGIHTSILNAGSDI